MSTILIKDSLRASVEAASGGAQTVLYTAKGQPTFMNIIQKYDMSTIDSSFVGTHPAFIIDGVEKSQLFIGTYEGVVRNGELLSLPNQSFAQISLQAGISACLSNGAGHHLMTCAEWGAVALPVFKSGVLPKGNSYYGRSATDATQHGRRADGLSPNDGITTGKPFILSGSGPLSFRHDNKYNGISDLVGNGRTMLAGVRIVYGEIQIIPNNNAALSTIDQTVGSSEWRAIDGRTGDLIVPNGSGNTPYAVRFGNVGSTDQYTLIGGSFRYLGQASSVYPVSEVALKRLKILDLFPIDQTEASIGGYQVVLSAADGVIARGGHYADGAASESVHSMRLGDSPSTSSIYNGVRPAYYQP